MTDAFPATGRSAAPPGGSVRPERPYALTAAEQSRVAAVHRRRDAGDVAALLDMLVDPSWTVRREVVSALAAIGAPATGPLCELLRTRRDDEARLAAAVDALVASRDGSVEHLAQLAADPEPAVAADAAQVLGRRRSSAALPVLVRLVAHPDDNVAVAAIEALARIGGRSAVEALLDALRSGNFFRVFPAIDVLGRSGDPRAVEPLARLLRQPTYTLEAARALGRMGESAAVAPLASLLAHPSDAVVRVAARALGELHARHLERYGDGGPVDEALRAAAADGTVRRLVRALNDADPAEQAAIASVLGVLGGESAFSALTGLLDAAPAAARAAAEALRRHGRGSETWVRQALRDGNSARRALLLPGVSRASAAPELVLCLGDEDPAVRALACDALARAGAVSATGALFALLGDADARVSQAAAGAIQSLGSEESARRALAAAADGDVAVRRAALRILAYFGLPDALPVFEKALGDADPRLRDTAIAGLAFLDSPRALQRLLELGRSADARTRAAALRALGQTTRADPRIAATLLAALRDEDAWVRYYAAQSLGRLGEESAVDALAALLRDPAGQVRVGAVEALTHFRGARAREALHRAAADETEPDMRRAALIGLGITKRPETLPVLLRAARASDPATRLVAVSALADSQSAGVVPALAQAARDEDENVRAAAIGFLAAAPGADTTRVLVGLLARDEERARVVNALAVPGDGRVPAIVAALDEADDEVAPLLVSALARMRTREAVGALFEALALRAVPARKAAAAALASLGSRPALEALRRAAEHDPDSRVRHVCAALLAR